jgi:DNA-binding NtrC family response regulator
VLIHNFIFAVAVTIGQSESVPDNFQRNEEIEVESVKILVLGDTGVGKYIVSCVLSFLFAYASGPRL